MSGTFHTMEWVRFFADSVFLTLGVVPILIAAARSLGRRDAPRVTGGASYGKERLRIHIAFRNMSHRSALHPLLECIRS